MTKVFRSYGPALMQKFCFSYDRVQRKFMWIREKQELGQILPGVQENVEKKTIDGNEKERVFSPQPPSPVNLAIASHFQPTSDNGTTALIIFSAAKSLGSYCKSQPDMWLSNYKCYGNGGLWVTVKVGTSCLLSLTADFLAITANIENRSRHTYAHMDTNTWICKQTGTRTNTRLLTSRDACAVLSNEPVIRPIRGS